MGQIPFANDFLRLQPEILRGMTTLTHWRPKYNGYRPQQQCKGWQCLIIDLKSALIIEGTFS
eukprot:m.167661 g.167661  ORF g.167661 m.167661 type:complete len:62 (+) comp38937_c1_seq2:153-338(+)